MREIVVIRPGLLTTVQDRGRWGFQHLGVPVAGPMDWYSHQLANRLVGNSDEAATLEVTLLGPELEIRGGVVQIGIAGAELSMTLDGRRVQANSSAYAEDGARIRFGERGSGARAYLSVSGGFVPAATLGSRATSLSSRMGPFGGRALKSSDILPIGDSTGERAHTASSPLRVPDGGARLRVMRGPNDDRFTAHGLDTLLSARYAITPESNRMGYRLAGAAIEHAGGADLLSDATPMGSLQVPASGQPILLLADRQTTGGYPKIATVITADLPIAGQLAPGDWVEFEACTYEEAASALAERLRSLEGASR